MISRIKYRRQVGNFMAGKRPVVEKGQVMRQEMALAENVDEKEKNQYFGFKCLHYSVSEASETLLVHVINKTGMPGRVRVQTIDAEARAGEDYEEVNEVLTFKKGDMQKHVSIKINDDDNWEPDEDFFVQLYDA